MNTLYMEETACGVNRRNRTLWKKGTACLLSLVLAIGMMLQLTASAQAAVSCKSLCQAVLKETGGEGSLKYKSTKAKDFGGFSASDREKVSSLMYLCDEKEACSICVIKASSNSGAAELLKSLKAYKANNSSSDYLSDYSASEQKLFKNAVCGRKGKYVWYIAMSEKKSVNKKGQDVLKQKLS